MKIIQAVFNFFHKPIFTLVVPVAIFVLSFIVSFFSNSPEWLADNSGIIVQASALAAYAILYTILRIYDHKLKQKEEAKEIEEKKKDKEKYVHSVIDGMIKRCNKAQDATNKMNETLNQYETIKAKVDECALKYVSKFINENIEEIKKEINSKFNEMSHFLEKANEQLDGNKDINQEIITEIENSNNEVIHNSKEIDNRMHELNLLYELAEMISLNQKEEAKLYESMIRAYYLQNRDSKFILRISKNKNDYVGTVFDSTGIGIKYNILFCSAIDSKTVNVILIGQNEGSVKDVFVFAISNSDAPTEYSVCIGIKGSDRDVIKFVITNINDNILGSGEYKLSEISDSNFTKKTFSKIVDNVEKGTNNEDYKTILNKLNTPGKEDTHVTIPYRP